MKHLWMKEYFQNVVEKWKLVETPLNFMESGTKNIDFVILEYKRRGGKTEEGLLPPGKILGYIWSIGNIFKGISE